MAYNKNEIAQILSTINDVEELLRKLTELSETESETLKLFFQDQKLVAALAAKLQGDERLAAQSSEILQEALKKENAKEILDSLVKDCDEEALCVGLLFQDPKKINLLLPKLQEKNAMGQLLSDFFVPALTKLSTQSETANKLGGIFLADALAKYLLDPRCNNAATLDAIKTLQATLTSEQAAVLTERLAQASVNEIASMSKEALDAIAFIINKPGDIERGQMHFRLQNIFEFALKKHQQTQKIEEFEQAFDNVNKEDQDWVFTPSQQKYVELLTWYMSITPGVEEKYSGALKGLANCLYNDTLLEGRTGAPLLAGLQKNLSTPYAKKLGNLLAEDAQTYSAIQFKNAIAILSGNESAQKEPERMAIVRNFCMSYLKTATADFSHPLPLEKQALFMEGLKSVPVAAERKALATLALKSNRKPSIFATWLVDILPSWLCTDSLRARAKPATGFTSEHIATLKHIAQNNGQLPSAAAVVRGAALQQAVLPQAIQPAAAPAVVTGKAPQQPALPQAPASDPIAGSTPRAIPGAKTSPQAVARAPFGPTVATPPKKRSEPVRIGENVKTTVGFGAEAMVHNGNSEEQASELLPTVAPTSASHATHSKAQNRYILFGQKGNPTGPAATEALSQSAPTLRR